MKRKFPAAYEADLATERGSKDKLGTISAATVPTDGSRNSAPAHSLTVVNAYTQFGFGPRKDGSPPIDYAAVSSAFSAIKDQYSGKRIGFPLIGAGLAGGDWGRIQEIIKEQLEGEDFTLVQYKTTPRR